MSLPTIRPSSSLSWWDPLRELDDLHQRMNQLVNSVFGSTTLGNSTWIPAADVSETDDAYLVEVEVPGVKRDDLDVQTTGHELAITGEFKERERAGWWRTRTRRVGRFEYRTALPQDADLDRISADLADGVLTVRVPKSDRARPRRIPINS